MTSKVSIRMYLIQVPGTSSMNRQCIRQNERRSSRFSYPFKTNWQCDVPNDHTPVWHCFHLARFKGVCTVTHTLNSPDAKRLDNFPGTNFTSTWRAELPPLFYYRRAFLRCQAKRMERYLGKTLLLMQTVDSVTSHARIGGSFSAIAIWRRGTKAFAFPQTTGKLKPGGSW